MPGMLISKFRTLNITKTKSPPVIFLTLFLQSSSIHWSSRSRPSFHNFFLRKRRKWPLPHSPHEAKWQDTFTHQLAMGALLKTPSETHLLSALVQSFAAYGSQPSPRAYHFVLKTLTAAGDWDQVSAVLHHLENVATFETPEFILIDLIKSCGISQMPRRAVEVFFRIPNFRCKPSVKSLNALLSVLCTQKCVDALSVVPEILTKSSDMNIALENSTFEVLIRGLCRYRKVGHAVEMLHQAVSEGFDLDGKVFSLILSTMCQEKSSHETSDVLAFFEEFGRSVFAANMADWCNVIQFVVEKSGAKEAVALLKKMKKEGMKPDMVSCNRVLKGLVMEEEYEEADELFDEMLVWGLVPDIFTYNAHICSVCKQGDSEQAIKMLGCRPDWTTYGVILGAFYRRGELGRVKLVVQRMEMKGVAVNMRAYEAMISACCGASMIEPAVALLRKMADEFKSSSVQCSAAFDQVVFGFCQRGLFDEAMELVREMAVGSNLSPGRGVWEALVQAYAKPLESSELDSARSDQSHQYKLHQSYNLKTMRKL